MFLDASVIIALLAREDDWQHVLQLIENRSPLFVSSLSLWETTVGLVRRWQCPFDDADQIVRDFVARTGAQIVAIDAEIGREALLAWARFGKGRHPAALNFGDCFAYACARTLDLPLLAKGNDFPMTDIRLA